MKIELFSYTTIKPLSYFGVTHTFFDVNISTLLYTWLAMAILFTVVLIGRRYLARELNPISLVLEQSIEFFSDLCIESFGHFNYKYFAFVAALFFFTFACNLVGLLPYIEEPTNDLHTTVALGLSSFLYVQYQKVLQHGILGYFREYAEPMFIMIPLNIIGELAKVMSMSFRLFGNIFGGSIVVLLAVTAIEPFKLWFMGFALITLVGYWLISRMISLADHPRLNKMLLGFLLVLFILPGLQLFFGIFEGFIQAFVIAILTLTYLAMGTASPSADDTVTSGEH